MSGPYAAPSGEALDAALHVVTEVLVEPLAGRLRATVTTWRDAAAFAAGKRPVDARAFAFGPDELAGEMGAGLRRGLADLEAALLTRPAFADAVAVGGDAPAAPPADSPPSEVIAATAAVDGDAGDAPAAPDGGVIVALGSPPERARTEDGG